MFFTNSHKTTFFIQVAVSGFLKNCIKLPYLSVRIQCESFLNCNISDSLLLIFRKNEKRADV